jgi:Zn-dependent protease/predicted transcriptional regulator
MNTMSGNFSIGRFGGIEVRLNWSLLAVFALIVWSLADGVFPSTNPGLSHGDYLAMAIVAALLFFGSILLHELGHSWAARREGIEVDSITLWLFGGVSNFKGRFTSPGAEFRIALSGPLVSIVLGAIFVLLAVAHLPSAVDGVAAWLGYINLILAVFNLIPALPLDGGRVLHAGLWRARGDFAWATRVASEIGQGFGYLFIALGLAMFIFQGSFSGAWLAFIGWFLLQAARSEARYVATEQALEGVRVRDLMVRHPVTVDADSTISQFMDDVAWSQRFTTYPVLEGVRPIGLLPFASVAAVPRSDWDTRRIRDTMTSLDRVPRLTEDERAVDALADLSAPTANRGLVVDNGHLVGLLSITDLARALEVGPQRAKHMAPRGV